MSRLRPSATPLGFNPLLVGAGALPMLFAVLSVAFGQSFNPLLVGAGGLPPQNASPSPIKLFQAPSCRGGSAPTEEEYLMITVRFGFQSPFLSGRERSLTDDMVAASDD